MPIQRHAFRRTSAPHWLRELFRLAGFKLVLANPALRADPIVREILEGGSRGHPVVGIANLRIVDIAAHQALVFLHSSNLSGHPAIFLHPPRDPSNMNRPKLRTGKVNNNYHSDRDRMIKHPPARAD